ncbi:MAG: family 10 glycosylhydrolase [Prevotella sp.]|nr:family 10 glycosylhydrolase [Prevotella sp.]
MRKQLFMFLLAAMFTLNVCSQQYSAPKREFRGAWIQAVNGQWLGLGTKKMQETLTYQLDELQKDGVNAIIFQVRPECDALYESSIEPWSRFLTGEQGVAPQPYWDPLRWMVDECHKRGMELHAWINPYRAKTKVTTSLAYNHIAKLHPERVFSYDGLYILNPALAENREYICRVVGDILRRYDVDGLHIDDYFYPYPVAGKSIPDDREFQQYNNGIKDRGDWRRENVNMFIRQLNDTIRAVKPWVKFGVSPFGIYRNQKSDPKGSRTNGLQNYDDLYADVKLWAEKGWIDYCVPQIYWEIGNRAADYETLIRWWDENCSERPLYIGEDIERTVKYADKTNPKTHQMSAKYQLHQECGNVQGTVLWYAKTAVDNVGNYGRLLRERYWRYPALHPRMPFIDSKAPGKVGKLKALDFGSGPMLIWTAPKSRSWKDDAAAYVVYRFEKGEKINLDDPSKIVTITRETYYNLPEKSKSTYVVTALDRMSNESKLKKIKW